MVEFQTPRFTRHINAQYYVLGSKERTIIWNTDSTLLWTICGFHSVGTIFTRAVHVNPEMEFICMQSNYPIHVGMGHCGK